MSRENLTDRATRPLTVAASHLVRAFTTCASNAQSSVVADAQDFHFDFAGWTLHHHHIAHLAFQERTPHGGLEAQFALCGVRFVGPDQQIFPAVSVFIL